MIATSMENQEQSYKLHPKKALLWLSIVSMVMIFAGLTSAMVVSDKPGWFSFAFPSTLWYSTATLILSSLTMSRALSAAKKSNFSATVTYVVATLILGLAFAGLQWESWVILVKNNVFFSGNDASASFLYVLMGLHLLHLVGGLGALLVTWMQARRKSYYAGHTLGLELTAIFWHFLDGLWIYLFLFLEFK